MLLFLYFVYLDIIIKIISQFIGVFETRSQPQAQELLFSGDSKPAKPQKTKNA